ncbi:MAG: NAD+ synthase [Deltaproteobacteria bacterium]|nr:NAD+ synthase [Deltaproteobacteria bacterium]
MGTVRIAQAQINPTLGDFAGNVFKIVKWIERAREACADLVTFPELALCGYPPEDLLLRHGFLEDNRAALDKVLPHTSGIVVVLGFADKVDDKIYNAAALLSDSRIVDVYHKVELPNYGVFDERRYFRSGSGCVVFEVNAVRFSITICEDIWVKGSITERCSCENSVHVVLNISASPYHAGKPAVRRLFFRRFAAAANATLFVNNLVGGQDELVFDGGSFVLRPDGEVLASAKRFEEDLLVMDFRTDTPVTHVPGWNLARGYHVLSSAAPFPRAPIEPTLLPEPERCADIFKALALGTGDYVCKNGFTKAVLGLSGGIDSSLTAAIAVEALGPENVIGVTMPSHYTSSDTFSDAKRLADNLGIRLITVPVHEIFQSYVKALEEPFREGTPGVELENLQARIRGNILMALSNKFGWLVLTTGNKSETAVGYCTLYGDTAGGLGVVKDVPKTMVYELAEYVNKKAGREVIPASVIRRCPSAELKPDQKDQDSLPPYDVLDAILLQYVEEDKAPEEIKGFDPATVKEVVRMVDHSEYKRRQAPPGVKITPKAFGKDRRMPLTNRYLDYELRERQ